MKKFFVSCLTVTLIMGTFLLGEEFKVQTITDESDLPESFCTAWERGDYLVSDGQYLILIGGSSRTLQSILNYPVADAMGSIIGFVPAGKNLVGDLIAGPPYVRINEKRQEISYTSVQPVTTKGKDSAMEIEAVAPFEGDNGEKAQIVTRYRFFPNPGKPN